MIRIGDVSNPSIEDMRDALRGLWGAEESGETMTEVALGNLNVRIYSDTSEISPVSYKKGTSDVYVSSLALLAFADGSSSVEAVVAPKTYVKQIKMGVLIARQA